MKKVQTRQEIMRKYLDREIKKRIRLEKMLVNENERLYKKLCKLKKVEARILRKNTILSGRVVDTRVELAELQRDIIVKD